jgi:hypothetical protein
MSGTRPPRAHASLLKRPQGGVAALDAIVIPAARHAENLKGALHLAADLGVVVVVLCSRDAQVDEVLAQCTKGVQCVAVDVGAIDAPADLLPAFETPDTIPYAMAGSRGDLSLKRNLGLRLGRMCGWRNVLFLDDDIRELGADQVRRAASSLTHHAMVGMPADEFPDNSVVYHAKRLAGIEPGVFVSGSALLVDLVRTESFFPETYNEDWLFMAPALAAGMVATADPVQQEAYHPFQDPLRAYTEEFGDVLAEGLIGHLQRRAVGKVPTQSYWAHFLRQREKLIAETAACLDPAEPDEAEALAALDTAEATRWRLDAKMFTDYLAAWESDLVVWRDFLHRQPRFDSADLAALHLGLRSSVHFANGNLSRR